LKLDADRFVHREQDFMNYLSLHDYEKAIQLAIAMEQPGRLLSLFKDIRSSPITVMGDSKPSITGHPSVDDVIRTLARSELASLLRYVRNWNANAKTSNIAQDILYAVMKLRSADDVMKAFGNEVTSDSPAPTASLSKAGGGAELKELVDALIPYTERHLSRTERLVQDSYVVDYILAEMDDGMFDWEEGAAGGIMDVDMGVGEVS
jgi:U3 small nucleolar RNA-associated protein 13